MRLPDGARLAPYRQKAARWEPWIVLAPLVAIEWIGVLIFTRHAEHNGWLFYHGGDQTWYFTSSWLLGRGDLPETQIGYAWSFLLTPLTWITGRPGSRHWLAPFNVTSLAKTLGPAALFGVVTNSSRYWPVSSFPSRRCMSTGQGISTWRASKSSTAGQ